MPGRFRGGTKDPEEVFGELNLRRLRTSLGKKGDRLIPLFADTAVRFPEFEQETAAASAKRRKGAEPHVVVTKRVEAAVEGLFAALDSAGTNLADASARGYVAPPGPSGELGRLEAQINMERKLDRLRDAATTVRDDVRSWRRRAEADAKRKRGRKVGDRLQLAEWVAMTLQRANLPVKKSKDGLLAKTLEIVYEASGIKTKVVYQDVRAAVDVVRQMR